MNEIDIKRRRNLLARMAGNISAGALACWTTWDEEDEGVDPKEVAEFSLDVAEEILRLIDQKYKLD